MNKKLLGMVSTAFLICIGVIGFQSDVNAVAYDGMEGKTVVNPESNKEAIELAKEVGALENSPVPIENLTTEEPVGEVIYNQKAVVRGSIPPSQYKHYAYQARRHNGLWNELRINELAPVGFTWVENGVPERSVTPKPYSTVNFYSGYTDKQVGGYSQGYYWRLFETRFKGDDGKWKVSTVWLSAWNLQHLKFG
ncbi:TPA: hypothetical protein ACNKKE_002744 [Enterococcus faecalis]|uniref:hypothetical protein n=1 Tax=Enterococcus faecalis TaxID=1351 RepID=UPI000428E855|nr:hypothetical protein [Enterococcus faecalis]